MAWVQPVAVRLSGPFDLPGLNHALRGVEFSGASDPERCSYRVLVRIDGERGLLHRASFELAGLWESLSRYVCNRNVVVNIHNNGWCPVL